MKMKKVLILGANPETVSLIKKANQMGLYTIVTDYNPDAYAKQFACKAYNINAADVEAIVEMAEAEHVDGVLVGVAEALLPAYCDVCARLNKPCYSTKEVFDIMVNKQAFKNQCRKYGVPTIEEYSNEQIDSIRYPVIVKPTDSCSSKGITVCHNREELQGGIVFALQYSKEKKYLIERYMTGDEVIAYYVIQNGNPIFVAMCDRYTYKAKDTSVQLPNSYIFPSRHIKSYLEKSDKAVKNMIKGIGIKNGSIFFQAFVGDDETVHIYEPGYRLNGAQEHLIVSEVSGIDAKEMYIRLALDGNVADEDLETRANPCHEQLCCKLSPLVSVGKIAHISGLKEIEAMKEVISVNPSYRVGDTVTGEGTLKQIVCRFFIVATGKRQLKEVIEKIYSLLEVEDENGMDMLIGKFDTEIIETLY